MRSEGTVLIQLIGLFLLLSESCFATPIIRANNITTGDQIRSRTTGLTLANGGYAIVWEDSDGSGTGVFCKVYDDTGAIVVSDFLVNSFTTNNQSSPATKRWIRGNLDELWAKRKW